MKLLNKTFLLCFCVLNIHFSFAQNIKTPSPTFPGTKSEWNGYDRYDFIYNNREAIVVAPKETVKGNPWIWRPAFFDAFPSVDIALLDKGFHVVYYDLTHLYGSPRSVLLGTEFYQYLQSTYTLSEKVTLEGFSRGGLFVINWAAKNPEKVACIYLDAPVCDVFSWPGRTNKALWNDLLKEWKLTDNKMDNFTGNPIDNLAPLAQFKVPIISVCGGSDQTVPINRNMDILRKRYIRSGGPVELIIKPGVDHHPHSLEDPEPILNFILRNQPAYKAYQHIIKRGSIHNSFHTFEEKGRGRVAFIGGSITEMNGWKEMVKEQLKRRFPYTEFDFIDAGIASAGTTPGAFRLENDILSKGITDLLFVEAAVNDDTNHFTPLEQVRGMEGEIRHALQSNPNMDIIMLHFIYDPFIPLLDKGKQPDVIMNHERVANHYLIPSINLAQEITERMSDKEFTWEQFGGTHPLPFGHTYYAATISSMFDEMMPPIDTSIQVHEIPHKQLDDYSYTNGRFIDIRQAELSKGWQLIESWNPNDADQKRKGFVDVPMLVCNQPNASLQLSFTGKAIGIFCVAGSSAGILEYSIDDAPYESLDLFTEWSKGLYIPWVYMLNTELENKTHILKIRLSENKNKQSNGTECIIRNFVVNQY